MGKYRLVMRKSLYNWWTIQEKRWWGWKMIYRSVDYECAIDTLKKLEAKP